MTSGELLAKLKECHGIFDFDSRKEVTVKNLENWIGWYSDCRVAVSKWKDSDANWPESDREGRSVIVLTPLGRDGLLNPLQDWAIVASI